MNTTSKYFGRHSKIDAYLFKPWKSFSFYIIWRQETSTLNYSEFTEILLTYLFLKRHYELHVNSFINFSARHFFIYCNKDLSILCKSIFLIQWLSNVTQQTINLIIHQNFNLSFLFIFFATKKKFWKYFLQEFLSTVYLFPNPKRFSQFGLLFQIQVCALDFNQLLNPFKAILFFTLLLLCIHNNFSCTHLHTKSESVFSLLTVKIIRNNFLVEDNLNTSVGLPPLIAKYLL